MNPPACVDRNGNRARKRVDLAKISNVRPGHSIVRTHGHNRQALGFLRSKPGFGGAETGFRASKIRPRAQGLDGCSFVCYSGQRTIGEWINYGKVLIYREPNDAAE